MVNLEGENNKIDIDKLLPYLTFPILGDFINPMSCEQNCQVNNPISIFF